VAFPWSIAPCVVQAITRVAKDSKQTSDVRKLYREGWSASKERSPTTRHCEPAAPILSLRAVSGEAISLAQPVIIQGPGMRLLRRPFLPHVRSVSQDRRLPRNDRGKSATGSPPYRLDSWHRLCTMQATLVTRAVMRWPGKEPCPHSTLLPRRQTDHRPPRPAPALPRAGRLHPGFGQGRRRRRCPRGPGRDCRTAAGRPRPDRAQLVVAS